MNLWKEEKQKMIEMFVKQLGTSEIIAEEYLQSEEWIYTEATYSYKADKRGII